MTHLSIVMPVYNELNTIRQAIDSVLAVDFPCSVELIVVDDGSRDGTTDILDQEYADCGAKIIHHVTNMGKGAAVRTGVAHASGSHVIIFDADLEYNPEDIALLVQPVIAGQANHVFGTRVFGMNTSFQSFKFAIGGRFTTLVANLLFDSCVTDMHTCLKLFPLEDFRTLQLIEDGFGLDTQLTARLLRSGVRPYEVPISYRARSAADGKKITWTDGVECLKILVSVRSRRAVALPSQGSIPSLLPRHTGAEMLVSRPEPPVRTVAG
jgi:glycosyltransferase involved in cell wall biosynthesis